MNNTLEQRELGTTGISVSTLGLGTVKFGRNQGVKYPKSFSLPDDKTLLRLLAAAADFGINLLDTAPAYGQSETRLGSLIKKTRNNWIVVTKVGEEFEQGVSSYDFSKQHTRYSVERSLKRLQTDYLDCVLVHSDGNDKDIISRGEVLPTLLELKACGLIRSIGFSGKDAAETAMAIPEVDVIMATLNPTDKSQLPLIDQCRLANKGVLIKKALASGHAPDTFSALAYVLGTQGVTSAIVGTINQAHLKNNVSALTND